MIKNSGAIKKLVRKNLDVWDRFWFQANDRFGSEVSRILLGATIFYIVLIRSVNLDFFNEKSFIPRSDALLMMSESSRPIFSWNFWPDSWALAMHLLLLAALFVFTIGRGGRLIALCCFVLLMGFIQRNFTVLFGADVTSALFMFYFILNPAQNSLALRKAAPSKTKEWDQILSSVGFRMLQIQMVTIYTYTGFEKLRGASWWNGTALWTVLANPQMAIYDFSFLKYAPHVVGVLTYSGVIFEIYFIAAMGTKTVRLYWLAFGAVFHFLIGWWLDLMPFSLVMMSTYFCFMSQTEILKLFSFFKRKN